MEEELLIKKKKEKGQNLHKVTNLNCGKNCTF